jgi:predicted enzyme related to lactoylglutathione lyase
MGLAHGTIGWAGVALPDLAAGAAFYTKLFGWEVEMSESDSFPYSMFKLDGKAVAGMGELGPEEVKAGQPPVWSSYVIVDNLDATFSRAVELGAAPVMEPMDVTDAGRMFFIIDPVGAAVGFLQSGSHDGAEVFNVPGAMTWNEVASRDTDGAVSFYAELLGWNAETLDFDGFPYTMFKVGDRANGGAYDMSGMMPDDAPAHWLTWFIVDNCQDAAAVVGELGGSVVRAPEKSGMGVSAVVADPFGATFGIIAANQVDGQPPR